MLNYIMLQGRLTADPELTERSGKKLCRFSIAVQREGKDKETADFFNCTAWESTAEIVSEWYHKGDQIIVGGRMKMDRREKDGKTLTYPEVSVREIHFVGGRRTEIDGITNIDHAEIEKAFEGVDTAF